jgi:Domain of unknown function (DUF4157)
VPFRLPWPFGRPRRKRKPDSAPTPSANTPPDAPSAPSAAPEAPAPVQLARAQATQPLLSPQPAREPDREPNQPLEPDGPDLGLELLARMPAFSTPPMLGRLGGLPAMAQTLPTLERFLQKLPVPPPAPTLPGLGEAAEFAANLPSLAGFTEPGRAEQGPAFPAPLEPPSEPTDVLAPPGGMPGQVASLSGEAAVLEPSRPPSIPPTVVPTPAAAAPEMALPAAQVLRAIQPASSLTAAPVIPATGPAAAPPPVTPGFQPTPFWSPQIAPMTRVLSPEQTLTGNMLPTDTFASVQREVLRATGEEWASPAEFIQPSEPGGERVSAEQRDSIENQRGQGRPLEPQTRQRFEQAYGQPLDDVRIHTGPAAHATAQSLNAIAFASGSDLFFTQNTYEPASPPGLSLIGHELAHVIQQQYGVPGDADELRPPEDRYERQADQFAARALDTSLLQTPLTAQTESASAPVQRAHDDEPGVPGSPPALPAASTWAPGEQLRAGTDAGASSQPLASALPFAPRRPGDEPVQRFAASSIGSQASGVPTHAVSGAIATNSVPGARPSLESAPQRAAGLTEQLLSPALMLLNPFSLANNLPGLGRVSDAGQMLPVFRSISHGLPGLGSLPDLGRSLPSLGSAMPGLPDTSALTDSVPNLPNLPGGPPDLDSAAPAMPDLGGVAQSLGSHLPQIPPMPGLPSGLPSLGGLTPPAMPLAGGMNAASQAAAGAQAAGQQALGSITGMAPSGGDAPATPALPSLDKLTEHIWKEVQRKLKVERERSRGLA